MKNPEVKKFIEKIIFKEIHSYKFDKKSTENEQHCQYDDFYIVNNADYLKKILQSENFPLIITTLKEYLNEDFYQNCSHRYDAVYKLIWHCAQKMSYQDFYKAWHG